MISQKKFEKNNVENPDAIKEQPAPKEPVEIRPPVETGADSDEQELERAIGDEEIALGREDDAQRLADLRLKLSSGDFGSEDLDLGGVHKAERQYTPDEESAINQGMEDAFQGEGEKEEPVGEKTRIFSTEVLDTIFDPNFRANLMGHLSDKKGMDPAVISRIEGSLQQLETFRPQLDEMLEKGVEQITEQQLAGDLGKIFTSIKDQLPEGYLREVNKTLKNPSAGKDSEWGKKLANIASSGLDFVPVMGPAKMLIEAGRGRTLHGTKLEGSKQAWHALEGATFLALDITGVGTAVKGGKAAVIGSKFLTRAAAHAKVAGMSKAIYKPLFRFGLAVSRNPMLAKAVERGLGAIIKEREMRKAALALAA
ncbi:MAG: hypothetical protein COT91_02410 [Candidatus Doudnabacteria bacterium CG10_big_fil_rev_8_21_14_0_10_41_10]|uniref:Pre-toxin TG domain-containing protein n=1 Tax=Candidatus Doudnabacteria bacterium CG10_big_fil_rev_8_21_14_0_10_41_10 TaxID=1974551 RepID=A0A2H0VDT9_9BACT|nr:MAG: hypothetical protein COT91_02410 [Candidatus Doudnabacteria bacterium CG10_big_fil_rev_8_21_14_0_10_41_10]